MIWCWILLFTTTIAVAFNPELLIANKKGVIFISTETKKGRYVIKHDKGASSLVYHFKRKEIYAILKDENPMINIIVRVDYGSHIEENYDTIYDSLSISQYGLNKTNTTKIFPVSEVLPLPQCWAARNLILDWEENILYWTCDPQNGSSASICMANIDGQNIKTLKISNNPFESIDIDPYEKKLFVLELNNLNSFILPKNKYEVIHQFVNKVFQIRVDGHQKTILVLSQKNNKSETYISRFNYSGGVVNEHKPWKCEDPGLRFGINVLNSTVYWINNSGEFISSCLTSELSPAVSISLSTFEVTKSDFEWRIFHPDVQIPYRDYYCKLHNCSHGCQYTSWPKVLCECPTGMVLNMNKTTCIVPAAQKPSRIMLGMVKENTTEHVVATIKTSEMSPSHSLETTTSLTEEHQNIESDGSNKVHQNSVPFSSSSNGWQKIFGKGNSKARIKLTINTPAASSVFYYKTYQTTDVTEKQQQPTVVDTFSSYNPSKDLSMENSIKQVQRTNNMTEYTTSVRPLYSIKYTTSLTGRKKGDSEVHNSTENLETFTDKNESPSPAKDDTESTSLSAITQPAVIEPADSSKQSADPRPPPGACSCCVPKTETRPSCSANKMTMFYIAITTLWFSVFIIVVVIKRSSRRRRTHYISDSYGEEEDITL